MTKFVSKYRDGRSGGLQVFWKSKINLHLRAVSRLYIDVDVVENDDFIWRFMGMYGEQRSDQKELIRWALRTLNAARSHPWPCLGDFNEVLSGCEKEGSHQRRQICMDHFREALEHCALSDLGFKEDMFIWRNNNHRCAGYIREHLDRALTDNSWCTRVPAFREINGKHCHSNHHPVILITEDTSDVQVRGGALGFGFLAGSVQEDNCEEIVENAWKLAMDVRGGRVAEVVKGRLEIYGTIAIIY